MNKAVAVVLIGIPLCLSFVPGVYATCAISEPVFHAFDSYFECADTGPVAAFAYQVANPIGANSGIVDIVAEGAERGASLAEPFLRRPSHHAYWHAR